MSILARSSRLPGGGQGLPAPSWQGCLVVRLPQLSLSNVLVGLAEMDAGAADQRNVSLPIQSKCSAR